MTPQFSERFIQFFCLQSNVACFARKFDSPSWGTDYASKGDPLVDEVMADYSGLLIGYKAAQEIWQRKGDKLEFLPGFGDSLTKEQMFFIITAFRSCSARNFIDIPQHSPHPPWAHRINKGFANFAPFRQAFDCKTNDPMVASRLCRVFIRDSMIPGYTPEETDTTLE